MLLKSFIFLNVLSICYSQMRLLKPVAEGTAPIVYCDLQSNILDASHVVHVAQACTRITFPSIWMEGKELKLSGTSVKNLWMMDDKDEITPDPLLEKNIKALKSYNPFLRILLKIRLPIDMKKNYIKGKNITLQVEKIFKLVKQLDFYGIQIMYYNQNGLEDFLNACMELKSTHQWQKIKIDTILWNDSKTPKGFWKKFDRIISYYKLQVYSLDGSNVCPLNSLRGPCGHSISKVLSLYEEDDIKRDKMIVQIAPGMTMYFFKQNTENTKNGASRELIGVENRLSHTACYILTGSGKLTWDTSRAEYSEAVYKDDQIEMFYEDITSMIEKFEEIDKLNLRGFGIQLIWKNHRKIINRDCQEINMNILRAVNSYMNGYNDSLQDYMKKEDNLLFHALNIPGILTLNILPVKSNSRLSMKNEVSYMERLQQAELLKKPILKAMNN